MTESIFNKILVEAAEEAHMITMQSFSMSMQLIGNASWDSLDDSIDHIKNAIQHFFVTLNKAFLIDKEKMTQLFKDQEFLNHYKDIQYAILFPSFSLTEKYDYWKLSKEVTTVFGGIAAIIKNELTGGVENKTSIPAEGLSALEQLRIWSSGNCDIDSDDDYYLVN